MTKTGVQLRLSSSGSGNSDVTIPQVFSAPRDESKLRARPRPPAAETA